MVILWAALARHWTRNKRCLVPATCSPFSSLQACLQFNCNPSPFLSCWGVVDVVHQIIWTVALQPALAVHCAPFQLLEYHQHQAPALGSGAPDNFDHWSLHTVPRSPPAYPHCLLKALAINYYTLMWRCGEWSMWCPLSTVPHTFCNAYCPQCIVHIAACVEKLGAVVRWLRCNQEKSGTVQLHSMQADARASHAISQGWCINRV